MCRFDQCAATTNIIPTRRKPKPARPTKSFAVALDWTVSRRTFDCGHGGRVAADGLLLRRDRRRRLEDDRWRNQLGTNHGWLGFRHRLSWRDRFIGFRCEHDL